MSRPVTIKPGLYNMPDAAARLGISPGQAYELDNAGRFPVEVIYVGAVRKVRIAELEAFLQGSAPMPAPGCPTVDDDAVPVNVFDTDGRLVAAVAR
jgi:hypothetical protein